MAKGSLAHDTISYRTVNKMTKCVFSHNQAQAPPSLARLKNHCRKTWFPCLAHNTINENITDLQNERAQDRKADSCVYTAHLAKNRMMDLVHPLTTLDRLQRGMSVCTTHTHTHTCCDDSDTVEKAEQVWVQTSRATCFCSPPGAISTGSFVTGKMCWAVATAATPRRTTERSMLAVGVKGAHTHTPPQG